MEEFCDILTVIGPQYIDTLIAQDILIYGTRGMQSAVHLINEIMKLEVSELYGREREYVIVFVCRPSSSL